MAGNNMTKSNEYKLLKPQQKALEINLNDSIYGTFAEIGAGQEVARNFFQVGAAAGTIVKTMSAYDKAYSDAIYGIGNGRYVSESRLYDMLDHEYQLIEERLQHVCDDKTYFVFADTVAAINYTRTIKGNGWIGIRFQHQPCDKSNEVVLHVKMTDTNNRQQQEAIGILGVNLLYACYHYRDNMEYFIKSLIDGIKDRVKVDMIRVNGDAFDHIDNRLLSLYLIKHGLSEVCMLSEDGNPIHASEFLYKRDLMVVRGNFRPPTLVTEDVFEKGFKQFNDEDYINNDKSILMSEITINEDIDEKDFLHRAKMLNGLGQKIIVSNCHNHQELINYLQDYKVQNLGLVIGVMELLKIIETKHRENQDGRLLVAFGELFTRNIKIYIYPAVQKDGSLMTLQNLPVPEDIELLYKHLLRSEQLIDITDFDEDKLGIFSWDVLESIKNGTDDWKSMVPERIIPLIQVGKYLQ